MKKFLAILFTGIVVSLYYFSFEFTFLPGINTKMFMAAVGIPVCLFKLVRQGTSVVPKEIVNIFLYAIVISVVGFVSMTYNHTGDNTYALYITSMAVWLSSAFVVCSLIKIVHSNISVKLIANYIIGCCVFQCIMAIIIDSNPAVMAFVDRYVSQGQAFLHATERLYGIGASLDTAGARFSCGLVMLAGVLHYEKDRLRPIEMFIYIVCFLLIVFLGSMIARTTYVGAILAVVLFIFAEKKHTFPVIEWSTVRIFGFFLLIVVAVVSYGIYKYNTSAQFHDLIRFAFEGFFNLFEKGEYQVSSNDALMDMYVFPDNLKTWIIGDGYFNNPGQDLNYIGEITGGYYKNTDVGYLRLIYYFGISGLLVFSAMIVYSGIVCIRRIPQYKFIFILITFANFIIWLKVGTDTFFALAPFICMSFLQDTETETDL